MPQMSLPVKLSDADRLNIQQDLSTAITAKEEAEEEKREAMRGHNATIKAHAKTIHDLNESLVKGEVLRDVEIEERVDWEAGLRFIYRLDTDPPECVKQVAIDPVERQQHLGLPDPQVAYGVAAEEHARTDEQRDASTPEEAEQLRAERLANERAERISAAVTEARGRIHILEELNPEDPAKAWTATLQHGNVVLSAEAETADAARAGVETQLVEHLEAEEDAEAAAKMTWAEVAAASQAEQDRQELERLAAEQAADDEQTKKRTLKVGAGDGLKNGGLKAPKRKKGITAELPDGRTVDPEVEAAAQAEPPTPGDDGPVATGAAADVDPDTGLAF